MSNKTNTNQQPTTTNYQEELYFQAISLVFSFMENNRKYRKEYARLSLTNKGDYEASCPCTFHIEKSIRKSSNFRTRNITTDFKRVRCSCNKIIIVTKFSNICQCKLCSENRE